MSIHSPSGRIRRRDGRGDPATAGGTRGRGGWVREGAGAGCCGAGGATCQRGRRLHVWPPLDC